MEKLNKFAWDNNVESVDFFGEVETNPNLKNDEKDAKDKLEDLDDSQEKKETDEELVDVFKDVENIDTNEEEEEEEEESSDSSKTNKKESNTEINNLGVANFLKEKGFLNFELEDGEELDEEKAFSLIEDKFEESVDSKVEELMKTLPEDVKNLVKYAVNGGDVNSYLNTISSTTKSITKDLDLEDEKNQEFLVREKLKAQGEDDEYIQSQIEFLKEKNKLGDVAEKYFEKVLSERETKEKELVEKQKQAKKEAKENQLKFKKEISTILEEKEEVKGLKFNKQDKRELPEYISSASIELQDGRTITPFYNDLFETLKDKDKTLLLAKLIKSDFDFSSIEKEAQTKSTKQVKDNLERKNETSVKKGSSQPKRITDYFND